jgi:DNA-binding MarR family transcriptional regulator
MAGEEKSVGKWISVLNRHCQAYISRSLSKFNIGSGQYIFVLALYDKNGINQDTLSDMLSIDKGTTAKALKKLEEEGYIRREIDEKDRRANRIYVTEKALGIKVDICSVLEKCNNIVSLNLSEEEREMALVLLEKMSINAVNFLK